MGMEIERKWLIVEPYVPVGEDPEPLETIEQSYFYDDQNTSGRVRKSTVSGVTSHWLTTKMSQGPISRVEVEIEITPIAFEALKAMSLYSPIQKYRQKISLDGSLVAEVDVFEFESALESDTLALVEVEFDSVEAADAFNPPSWFGPEVSKDWRYLNSEIARHGKPVPTLLPSS